MEQAIDWLRGVLLADRGVAIVMGAFGGIMLWFGIQAWLGRRHRRVTDDLAAFGNRVLGPRPPAPTTTLDDRPGIVVYEHDGQRIDAATFRRLRRRGKIGTAYVTPAGWDEDRGRWVALKVGVVDESDPLPR